MDFRKWERKCLSLAVAASMALACALPASAAESGVGPVYDEAYYATLDYYGNLTEGSVVKSYILNGADSLTDYGSYEAVTNLTDATAPVRSADKLTFTFDGENAPSHFYFQGKTSAPFEEMPWTLSLCYTLNGMACKAEDLAGKTGVVEISIDAIPNPASPAYMRNNYTLEAMALFNQDDIVSLEAPGAQVQLIGNLRAVLFVALPGEEQHFVLRVGAEDFSFDGMTFLMVPATLSQLDQIAELNQKKDRIQENYDRLSGSLDALLDSFTGMEDSLSSAADGLDKLDTARAGVSSGKGEVYSRAETLRNDLDDMVSAMAPVSGDLSSASASLTKGNRALGAVTEDLVSLRAELDGLDTVLGEMRSANTDVLEVLDDFTALSRSLTALRDGNEDVRIVLQDMEDLGGLMAGVRQQQEALDGVLDGLADLESLLADVDAATGAAETVLRDLSGLGNDFEDLRDNTDALRTLLDDVADLRWKLKALRDERGTLDRTLGSLSELERRLKELRGSKTAMETLLGDLTALGDALRGLDDGTGALSGLAEQLERVGKAIYRLRYDSKPLADVVRDLNDMEGNLNDLAKALGSGESLQMQQLAPLFDGMNSEQLQVTLEQERSLRQAFEAVNDGKPLDEQQFMAAMILVSPPETSVKDAKASAGKLIGVKKAVELYQIDHDVQTAIVLAAGGASATQESIATVTETYRKAAGLHRIFNAVTGEGNEMDYPQFLKAALLAKEDENADEHAKSLYSLYLLDKANLAELLISNADDLNNTITETNGELSEFGELLSGLAGPTAELLGEMAKLSGDAAGLLDTLESADNLLAALQGLIQQAGGLDSLTDSASTLLGAISKLSADSAALKRLLDNTDTLIAALSRLTGNLGDMDGLLNRTDALIAALSRLSGDAGALDGLITDADSLLDALGGLSGDAGELTGLTRAASALLEGLEDLSAKTGGLKELTAAAGELLSGLEGLSADTGELDGILDTGDGLLSILADTAADAGELDTLVDSADGLAELGQDSSAKLSSVLEDIEVLYGVMNNYEPQAQSALAHSTIITNSLTRTMTDSSGFFKSLDRLMQSSGTQLDAGTKASLGAFSTVLRDAAGSFQETESVRDAKNGITDIIEDLWDEYTGEDNALLLIDSGAEAVSLTDARNGSPESVQILIRTQEIKAGDAEKTASDSGGTEKKKGNIFSRIGQMFQNMFLFAAGLFHK